MSELVVETQAVMASPRLLPDADPSAFQYDKLYNNDNLDCRSSPLLKTLMTSLVDVSSHLRCKLQT